MYPTVYVVNKSLICLTVFAQRNHVTDRLTDTPRNEIIGRNSLHFVHSMPPKIAAILNFLLARHLHCEQLLMLLVVSVRLSVCPHKFSKTANQKLI